MYNMDELKRIKKEVNSKYIDFYFEECICAIFKNNDLLEEMSIEIDFYMLNNDEKIYKKEEVIQFINMVIDSDNSGQ